MPCAPIQNGIACSFTNAWVYICLEHTTYIMEFSDRFGPSFWRVECGKEIEVDIEFDDNDEPVSNRFLWDIFDEWYESIRNGM